MSWGRKQHVMSKQFTNTHSYTKTHMERDEEAGDEEGFTVDPLQMCPGNPVHW